MRMAGWQRGLVAVLSAGWLIPMWMGCTTMLQFIQLELWPQLLQQPALNSFPFIDHARDCFGIAFLWLGLVIVAWAWVGTGDARRTNAP